MNTPSAPAGRLTTPAIFIIMSLAAMAAYLPMWDNGFINFDDNLYVFVNSMVRNGLTTDGAWWAMTATDTFYWHPLTWMSLMADMDVWGLSAQGVHFTNLMLHLGTAGLFLVFLRRATGRVFAPALAAALFALHPMAVDSVAWAAERKTVLSGLFWMATLVFWLSYARTTRSRHYLAALACMAASLLAKPVAVTLPFVLLLMDHWPLNRLGLLPHPTPGTAPGTTAPPRASLKRLILEKIPFFALTGANLLIITALRDDLASDSARYDLGLRLANAATGYVRYLGKLIWPMDLTVYYPYPEHIPAWQWLGALALLAALTLLAWKLKKSRPALLMGWLWFLGVLVPTSGIVQAGLWPAIADRFAYLPLAGIYMVLAWALPRPKSQDKKSLLCIASLVLLTILVLVTQRQTEFWKDDLSLFTHCLEVSGPTGEAHNALSGHHLANGNLEEAERHALAAMDLEPENARSINSLGLVRLHQDKLDQAEALFDRLLTIKDAQAQAFINLGAVQSARGNMAKGLELNRMALEQDPTMAVAYNNIAGDHLRKGRLDKACEMFRDAVWYNPASPTISQNYANALLRAGKVAELRDHIVKSLRLEPGNTGAIMQLATLLLALNAPEQAVPLFEYAVHKLPDNPAARNGLGTALARLGRSDQAEVHFRKAVELAPRMAAAYVNLGQVMLDKGKIKEALPLLREALDIHPGLAAIENKLDKAQKDLDKNSAP